jgi:prophage DNA circulation protein
MPQRRRPGSILDAATAASPRGDFRRRYADVEARRAELIARLRKLGAGAQVHPGYRRALTLLNDTFRKSKLAQRLAVLQAAAWLIDVLERLTSAI